MAYSNYIVVRNTNFKNPSSGKTTMSAAVIFAYNTSINETNRTCTITGCFAIKSYLTSQASYWYSCDTNSSGVQDHWLNNSSHTYKTTGTLAGQSYSLTNYRGGNFDGDGNANLISVTGINSRYSNDNGYQWTGGPWKFTDNFSITYQYGPDETIPVINLSVSHKNNTTWLNGWASWSSSVNFSLPFIESSSTVRKSENNGAAGSWVKNKRVYKTTNGGLTWEKCNVYKTTNNGASGSWTKVK